MSEQSLKLTAYFGERERVVGEPRRFLADGLLDLFGSRDIATSVMLRGITSFGPKGDLRSDSSLSLSEDPRSRSPPSTSSRRSVRWSSKRWR